MIFLNLRSRERRVHLGWRFSLELAVCLFFFLVHFFFFFSFCVWCLFSLLMWFSFDVILFPHPLVVRCGTLQAALFGASKFRPEIERHNFLQGIRSEAHCTAELLSPGLRLVRSCGWIFCTFSERPAGQVFSVRRQYILEGVSSVQFFVIIFYVPGQRDLKVFFLFF